MVAAEVPILMVVIIEVSYVGDITSVATVDKSIDVIALEDEKVSSLIQ